MASKPNFRELARFGTVYRKPGALGHAYRRRAGVEALLRHIDCATRKSFLLVGSSGVGKTAMLHEVFRALVVLPEQPWTIVQTSAAQLMTGTKYIGEWQTRVADLVRVAKAKFRVLIYVSDVHNLRGAGRSENDDSNMAEAFAPHIERGKIIVVGECTAATFCSGIEAMPALGRNFTTFKVNPMSAAETPDVLRDCFVPLAEKFARTTGLQLELPEPALAAVSDFGGIYFPNDAQPGAAVRLLGHVVTACADVAEAAPPADGRITINQGDVVRTLERFTGVPRRLLDDSIKLDPAAVRQFFDSRVIGQTQAVAAVGNLITLVKAGLSDPEKPLSVMLFSGPTGVGKTELAKALAEYLFGSPERMIRCDMSEYKDSHSFEKLLGSPFSPRGGTNSSLVAKVRQQPFSVVLFDEVEKAHPNVFDVLLQAFDDGRLTDPAGDTTNLTQTIMILTTNLGGDLAASPAMGFGSEGLDLAAATDKALRDFFRPEFLNRIDHILRFKALDRDDARTLARRELGRAVLRSGLTRRELRVDIQPAVIDLLVKHGFDKLYGARPLKRAVENRALLPVARQIVQMGAEAHGSLLRLSAKGDEIVATLVRDRQARTAARISGGIDVELATGDGKRKVRPAQIAADLTELATAIEELERRQADDALPERKSVLVERSGEVDFWDDPATARRTLGEIYRIERMAEAISQIRHRYTGLVEWIAGARRERDTAKLAAAADDLRAAGQHAGLLRFGISCRAPEDRRDALLSVCVIDPAAGEQNLPKKLADAYTRWAKRKGYDVQLLHEERSEAARPATRELVLEICGPAAFGILRAEAGLHEFVSGKSARSPRTVHHLSVRVLASPTERERDKANKVSTKTSTAKKFDGAFGEPIKTRATASLAGRERIVVIASPLDSYEAAEAAKNLLLAELGATGQDATEVVRKYSLSPKQSVRDPNALAADISLQAFWNGEIDSLLHAGIDARTAAADV